MTVDQLVTKNLDAKGGVEALHALKSLKLTGKMLVNEGQMQFAFAQTKRQPDAVRNEYTLQGMTIVQTARKAGRSCRYKDARIRRNCRRMT